MVNGAFPDKSAEIVGAVTDPTRPQKIQQLRTRERILRGRARAAAQKLEGVSIEEYEREYAQLEPDLKPFFRDPAEVRAEIEAAQKKQQQEITQQQVKQRTEQQEQIQARVSRTKKEFEQQLEKYKDRERKYRRRYKESKDPQDKLDENISDALGDLYRDALRQLKRGADPVALSKAVKSARREIKKEGRKLERKLEVQIRDIPKQPVTLPLQPAKVKAEPDVIRLGPPKPVVKDDVIRLGPKPSKYKEAERKEKELIRKLETGEIKELKGEKIGLGQPSRDAVGTYNPLTQEFISVEGVKYKTSYKPPRAVIVAPQKIFSLTPGGKKRSAEEIADVTPGYSLAGWVNPIETQALWLEYKTGRITKKEYDRRLRQMEIRDITMGKTYRQVGEGEEAEILPVVREDQTLAQQFKGVLRASPVVQTFGIGAAAATAGVAVGGTVALTGGAVGFLPATTQAGIITATSAAIPTAAQLVTTGVAYQTAGVVEASLEESKRLGRPAVIGLTEETAKLAAGYGGFAAGFGVGLKSPLRLAGSKDVYPYQPGLYFKDKPIFTRTYGKGAAKLSYALPDEAGLGFVFGKQIPAKPVLRSKPYTAGFFQKINIDAPIPKARPQYFFGYTTETGKVLPGGFRDMPFTPSGKIQTKAFIGRVQKYGTKADVQYLSSLYKDVQKTYTAKPLVRKKLPFERVEGLKGVPKAEIDKAVRYLEYAAKTGKDIRTGAQLGVGKGKIDIQIGGSLGQQAQAAQVIKIGDVDVMISDPFVQTKVNIARGLRDYLGKDKYLLQEGLSTVKVTPRGAPPGTKGAFEFPIQEIAQDPFGFKVLPGIQDPKKFGTTLKVVPAAQERVNLLAALTEYKPGKQPGVLGPQAGRFTDIPKQIIIGQEFTAAGVTKGTRVVQFTAAATKKFGAETVGQAFLKKYGLTETIIGARPVPSAFASAISGRYAGVAVPSLISFGSRRPSVSIKPSLYATPSLISFDSKSSRRRPPSVSSISRVSSASRSISSSMSSASSSLSSSISSASSSVSSSISSASSSLSSSISSATSSISSSISSASSSISSSISSSSSSISSSMGVGGFVLPGVRLPGFGAPAKRKKVRRKIKRRTRREYQASVAAVSLGVKATPAQIRKLKKSLTGLELRPLVAAPTKKAKGKKRRKVNRINNKNILKGFSKSILGN